MYKSLLSCLFVFAFVGAVDAVISIPRVGRADNANIYTSAYSSSHNIEPLEEFRHSHQIAKEFPRRSVQSVAEVPPHKNIVVYYQTQYHDNKYISPSPLTGLATHLIIAAFHLNKNKTIHLNNVPLDDSSLTQMWNDATRLQESGIKVMGMLGGASQGAYQVLADDFDEYYRLLSSCIMDYKLDGVDLDVEEYESLENIGKLIKRLRQDFGDNFIITMAPVASALKGGRDTFSGFNYADLEAQYGDDINWYNVQFYSGYGSMENTTDYNEIVKDFPLNPRRLVAGTLTNKANGGGFVELDKVNSTVRQLANKYGDGFGGVAGWEYFNSMPHPDEPWKWAEIMQSAMGR
ncbi:hypothetical protein GALMADRAFT_146525 [Galerina marginata CBS 339.88]|uniref:GH18 domain-containing protein n=1 Tax=Galerina marginata (strain CBS 339.88) TaxID=685588 RepID=A0A067SE77_GALM3|nr:hypothetical protein GALMADRAFT_146525 [Galerina marginata CBS 339.88]